ERVMPSDVFAKEQELTLEIKKRAGMESAGPLKSFLCLNQSLREHTQYFNSNRGPGRNRLKLLPDRFDRRLAANPATRRSENVAAEFCPIKAAGIAQGDIDHVFR